MSKLSLIASIMLLLIFFGGIGAVSAAEISVEAPLSELKDTGQTIVFPIHITNAVDVSGYEVTVMADSAIFTGKANNTYYPTGFSGISAVFGGKSSVKASVYSSAGAKIVGSATNIQ